MKTETKTRVTTVVDVGHARKFAELTREIGISGTALLSRTVHAELDYLETLPPNSEEDERVPAQRCDEFLLPVEDLVHVQLHQLSGTNRLLRQFGDGDLGAARLRASR